MKSDSSVVQTPPPPPAEREPFLPFSAPWIGPEEKSEMIQALESDWITTGPRTKAFEGAFAEYIGCRNAIAVSSCTAALHLSLAALGIGRGDAVITTPLTFAATANVIVHCGAQPIFVDIRPDTYNLDAAKVEQFITRECKWDAVKQELRVNASGSRVRAIIPVHYAGHPCDMDQFHQLAEKYRLTIIEDAAHAASAEYRGRKVGTLGTFSCFSFYPTKNLTTGEGGMLTTDDPELARRARVLSLHGISRDAWKRYGKEGTWRYDVEEVGFKYNMTDLAAALGLHQLRKLEMFTQRRQELAALYRSQLAGLPLQHPTVADHIRHAWHLYPVQVLSERINRDQLVDELKARNIGSSVHFIPLHLMSVYQRRFGFKKGDFPITEGVFERIVSLPLFPRMRNEDLERVVGALREILR
ncbi:MAG TPA: DegT/DnrJ/EryC1/StrS aminotransferase family protein [Terriglobales bacterium]|jgi:dTDP-4-amino-4,6-dideoxygalactose transaminase